MVKRNLSGVFFRSKNPETGKFESTCFEDLPRAEQTKILNNEDPEWVKSLVFILCDTINGIGDALGLSKE